MLDEDEIQEFLQILRNEPNGIFAKMVCRGCVPEGIPVERDDVAKAIASVRDRSSGNVK